jgi:hypothetical protein
MRLQVRWLMRSPRAAAVVVAALASATVAVACSSTSHASNDSGGGTTTAVGGATPTASAPTAITATVGNRTVGTVQPGFVGLSLEIRGVEAYTGTDPHAINPVFEQLIRNLNPGERGVLRLGGDSTDWTWYPIPHMARPLGVRYSLSPTWFRVVRALAQGVNAHLIVGVNFEVNSPRVAGAEARAIVSGIGSPWVDALALGNEPELYAWATWFELHHVRYHGRHGHWGFPAFLPDYNSIIKSLPTNVPLAGPDVGSDIWTGDLGQFLAAEKRVKIATIHRYPLKRCRSSTQVTIPELLSDPSTRGFEQYLSAPARAASKDGVPIRLDETNTVSCGGALGVSNTFASALWSFDAMFEAARAGIAGVNVHTSLSSSNDLFTFTHSGGRWHGTISPDYYGLLAFAEAAPAGSQLLSVSGPSSGPIHTWATRATDGTIRVALINFDRHAHEVGVRAATATGTLSLLQAHSASSTGGITLGGQSFATGTTTGALRGTPHTTSVMPSGGSYRVNVPSESGAILTLPPS